MRGGGVRALGAAIVVLLVVPGVAHASTVTLSGPDGAKVVRYVSAGPTETAFDLDISEVADPVPSVVFADAADFPYEVGPGCTREQPAIAIVRCPKAGLAAIEVLMDGGDDRVSGSSTLPIAIDGGGGDDSIGGTFSFAIFRGGAGDDDLGLGSPTGLTDIHGGDGVDALDAWDSTADLRISLDGVANDGQAGQIANVRSDVEEVIGGSGDDELTGSDDADLLIGGAGDDLLHGLGGDDTLVAFPEVFDPAPGCRDRLFGDDGDDDLIASRQVCDDGAAVASGGAGVDRLSYQDGSPDLRISLDGQANDGFAAGARRDDVRADLEIVQAGNGNDVLVGSDAGELLVGGSGDDRFDGRGGSDTFVGDTGVGNAGVDVVDYSGRSEPVRADLRGETGGNGQSGEEDLFSADLDGVLGGAGDDVLLGDAEPNTLRGGGGTDRLVGGGSSDVLDGEDGDDALEARDGAIDDVRCGAGADRAEVEPWGNLGTADRVAEDCEVLDPARPSVPAPVPGPGLPVVVPRPRAPVVPAADTRAPKVALFARKGGGLVTTLRRTSLKIRIGCDEACRATATITPHGSTARSLARRGFRRDVTVARGTSRLGPMEQLTLKPTKRGARMLRALPRGRYRITAVVTDAAGNRTTVSRVVTITR